MKLTANPVTSTSYTDLTATLASYPPRAGQYISDYHVTAVDQAQQESNASVDVHVLLCCYFPKEAATTEAVPNAFALHQAYPNPFNPSTQINFDSPEDGYVSLNVFDVLGRKVGEIVNGNYAAGYHSATWNASGVSSGVYFARFTATDASGVVKLSKVSKLLLTK